MTNDFCVEFRESNYAKCRHFEVRKGTFKVD